MYFFPISESFGASSSALGSSSSADMAFKVKAESYFLSVD